jgi:signal transduction histidine kinase
MAMALVGAAMAAWWLTRGAALADAKERITLEFAEVATDLRVWGPDRALAELEQRSHLAGALAYRVEGASGARIAGTLAPVGSGFGWRRVSERATDQNDDGQLLVFEGALSDGSLLILAEDMDRSEGLQLELVWSLVLAAGIAMLSGLIIGLLSARQVRTRMRAVHETLRRVASGDLSARAPIDSSGDDIGEIASGINEMLDQIDNLVVALRRVSAEVAHDLRTPLTHVGQRLERAATASTPQARDEALESARTSVADAVRIFDAMLRLSEIEAGAARKRFTLMSITEVVSDAADAYRADIEAGGGVLRLELQDDRLVYCDRDLITQALSNLLENAVRYGGRGAPVEVSLTADHAWVTVTVRDHGPGIDPAHFDDAVRPFGRLDRARRTPGAGLGLAIVKAVARLHDGTVTLDSGTPGLKVRMALPAAVSITGQVKSVE